MVAIDTDLDIGVSLSLGIGETNRRLHRLEHVMLRGRTALAPLIVGSAGAASATNLLIGHRPLSPPSGCRWDIRSISVTPIPATAGGQPAVLTGIGTYFCIGNVSQPVAQGTAFDAKDVIDFTANMPTGASTWSAGEAPCEPGAQAYVVIVGAATGQMFVLRIQYDQVMVSAPQGGDSETRRRA